MEKRCKNKKCNKILPNGYKHKYCEACMNNQTHKAKGILGAVLSVAIVFITKGALGKKD